MHWPLSPRTKASEQSQPDMQISLQICGFPWHVVSQLRPLNEHIRRISFVGQSDSKKDTRNNWAIAFTHTCRVPKNYDCKWDHWWQRNNELQVKEDSRDRWFIPVLLNISEVVASDHKRYEPMFMQLITLR
jgi:hypothetical protein